jgi:circadian clock protein KaiC
MSAQQRVSLQLLPTGVPGFDTVLGGGLPEFSFNLITGTPGAGKTTLAHQIMFTNASAARPALYFTVMGEPPIKMLRYQQQMAFFDPAKVDDSVHFIDLSEVVLDQGLSAVLDRVVRQVEAVNPGIVVVDSFQAVVRAATATETGRIDLQSFTQRLAVHLTSWQATTFLVGEYIDAPQNNPVMTVADSIFALSQSADRNSIVRKLQVVKTRGLASMPGLHTFRISQAGLQVYPRISIPNTEAERARLHGRSATGVAGLDELVGGGIPIGDALLVSGPSGSGKSVLGTQFIAAGVRQGEPGVIAVFEEHPKEYLRRAQNLGIDMEEMERRGDLKMIYIRPLDLSPDETLYEIREAVQRIGAKRVVIDSVSGFELALAPTFRTDFRESLYRLVGALTNTGIIVLMTMEIVQSSTDLRFSPYVISFLADDIILLRYVEIAGQLRKSLAVVKMRNSDHSKDLRLYEITAQGLIVRESLQDYRGISTGAAELRAGTRRPIYPGLTDHEMVVLRALIELREAPAEVLARRTGLPEGPSLTSALDRLVSLNYAIRLDENAGTSYRPVTQALE